VKPGNLLLDTNGVAWVTDFGLARAADGSDASQSGHLAGTLSYMAPEQFRGQVEERTDLYGLGLTLYELITLQSAFAGDSRADLIRRITESRPPNPRSINPHIPADLETIVLKSIAPEPRHRYATVQHLADDLRRFLADRPIEARRVMPHERFWRWCRRNPAIAALSCLAVGLLVLTASLASVGYVREIAQRERMEVTLRISLDALDKVYRRFSSDRVVATSQLQLGSSDGQSIALPIRPAMSRETAEMLVAYDQLAQQDSGNITLRSEAAKATRRVGDIHQRLGEFDQAILAYENAIERLRQLGSESGILYTGEIARTWNELGNTFRALFQSDRADEAYGRARDTLETVVHDADDHTIATAAPELRYELARTYYYLGKRIQPEYRSGESAFPGLAQRSDGRRPRRRRGGGANRGPRTPNRDSSFDVKRPLMNQALELLDELKRAFPSIPEYRYLLAMCHRELTPGVTLTESDRAIEILEELVEQYPAVADYRFQLADSYGAFGPAGLARDELPLAEERLRTAIRHADTLAAQHPNVTHYTQSRAHLNHKLSEVILTSFFETSSRRDESRLDEGIHFCGEAVRLKVSIVEQFPESETNQMWLGRMRGHLWSGQIVLQLSHRGQ